MAEIDHLLSLEDGELVTYTENPELEKVSMWLNTPKGEYWGRPEWGNRLNSYKHEPVSASLEVEMENVIILDLERDLPSVQVLGISISALDVDQFTISVNTNYGIVEQPLSI